VPAESVRSERKLTGLKELELFQWPLRHPQSAKRSTTHTPNYNILSIMYTPAQARQGVAEAVRLDA